MTPETDLVDEMVRSLNLVHPEVSLVIFLSPQGGPSREGQIEEQVYGSYVERSGTPF